MGLYLEVGGRGGGGGGGGGIYGGLYSRGKTFQLAIG